MNDFILVTERNGVKKIIRIQDIVLVEGLVSPSPTIWYFSKLWKRGKQAIPLEVQESFEEIYAMLNGHKEIQ